MPPPTHTSADFDHSPMLVFYELTRACDLMCKHCRAEAQDSPDPNELSTATAKQLIAQIATFPKKPLLVLTGGDPLKRPDVFDLIHHATAAGLEVAMTPSATPLATADAIGRLKEAGLHRLAVSLDAADASTHDSFRRVEGSFARTLRMISDARSAGLPVQVNTTVTRHNIAQVDSIADLLAQQGIVLWSVFFLIPVGRASASERLSPEENEALFARLHALSLRLPYPLKTTEAPHYRRFLLQQRKATQRSPSFENQKSEIKNPLPRGPGFAGTNDGKGILFISHTGEMYPSGFLPLLAGRFPADSIVHVYQNAALFRALRDPDRLSGKCRQCEYRHLCGGSRARAYALTNDPLASDPDCAYIPPRFTPD